MPAKQGHGTAKKSETTDFTDCTDWGGIVIPTAVGAGFPRPNLRRANLQVCRVSLVPKLDRLCQMNFFVFKSGEEPLNIAKFSLILWHLYP